MLIKQTSRFITVCVVTLSLVTIACALVSTQFRIMQEQAYASEVIAAIQQHPQQQVENRQHRRTTHQLRRPAIDQAREWLASA